MPMIKCTDEQAYLIELCLETMCRASLGQLTHFVESIEKIRGKFAHNISLSEAKNELVSRLRNLKSYKLKLANDPKFPKSSDPQGKVIYIMTKFINALVNEYQRIIIEKDEKTK